MFSGKSGKQRGQAKNSQERVSNCVRTMPNVIGIRVYIDRKLVCVVLMSLRDLPLRSLKPVVLNTIK